MWQGTVIHWEIYLELQNIKDDLRADDLKSVFAIAIYKYFYNNNKR